jgi:hypothetical protein
MNDNNNNDYITILSVDRSNNNQPTLMLRVRKSWVAPVYIALGLFAILLLAVPAIDKNMNDVLSKLSYFLLGISFGASLPVIILKILEFPYLLVVYVYGMLSCLFYFIEQLDTNQSGDNSSLSNS